MFRLWDETLLYSLPTVLLALQQYSCTWNNRSASAIQWGMWNYEDHTTEAMLGTLLCSQLGMKDMFQQETADFSGITGSRELYVSCVLQKAFVEVTELGTEAGASSSESW